MEKVAQKEVAKIHTLEIGVVTAQHIHSSESAKEMYEVTVKLKNRDLILKKVPVATQFIGHTAIPNIDDVVIVAFMNGDINFPVVIGRLYHSEDDQKKAQDGVLSQSPVSKAKEYLIEFPSGLRFRMNDTQALIETYKTRILIDSKGKEADCTITLETGKTKMVMKHDKEITIEGNDKLDIKIKADTTLKADGKIQIEGGSDINIKASGNVNIKGSKINLN